jgi:hypothetical protein
MSVDQNLDYNLAYYALTQARANQLAIDQRRYIFVEFSYTDNNMLKNIYKQKDNQQDLIFKIEFNKENNGMDGNILVCKKSFYPETLYDYVTLNLDNDFYEFYLKNQYDPKYQDIDLRVLWYFVALDKDVDISIKKVRDTKFVFSYRKLCEAYEYTDKERSAIKVCCSNLGLLNHNGMRLCPTHYSVVVVAPH